MSDEQAPAPEPKPKPSAGLWPYLWAIIIGIALIPNGIMLTIALRSNTAAVEAQPYEASKDFDRLKAQRRAFEQHGLSLSTSSTGSASIELTLDGPVDKLGDVQLRFIRPADASLDHNAAWPDPTQPLRCELPARGYWQVELKASLGGETVATRATIYNA